MHYLHTFFLPIFFSEKNSYYFDVFLEKVANLSLALNDDAIFLDPWQMAVVINSVNYVHDSFEPAVYIHPEIVNSSIFLYDSIDFSDFFDPLPFSFYF